MFNFDIHS